MNYFEVPAMNASTIKAGAKSMLYMRHIVETPIVATPAMITGTHRHMSLLEPDKFDELQIFNGDKRTKEYKELKKDVGAENILSEQEYQSCVQAAEVARNHPIIKANNYLDGGVAEKEFYWDEKQGKAKAKIDYLKDDIFIEYKTTANIDAFHRTCENLSYHLGLAWYWRACGVHGVFVVQESNAPYDVAVFEVPEYRMDGWLRQCFDIWDRYLAGDCSGAYSDAILLEPADDDDISVDFE